MIHIVTDIVCHYVMEQWRWFYYDLYDLNIEELRETIKLDKGIRHTSFSQINDHISHISMKIQEFINNKMLLQKPVLINRYEQAQLINYCCNNNKFDYLSILRCSL